MGLTLPPERVELLAERTEGWIAGLQMAALSLQGEADPSGFLDSLARSSRYLMDYLSEEVLQRQPQDLRAFLGKTAFLDRLCGPLCDAVTGTPGGQAMLQRLEAANLFVIPLDWDRGERWYRYHHLFAAVLRSRLLPEQGEPLAVLHDRAAAWYEAEGMAEEAIEHALASGQFERAAPLIERLYESVWHPGLGRSLERWLRALPPALIRTRPSLSFVLASLHYYHFRAAAAEQVLNECQFEPQDNTPATRDLHGRLLMARGWTARLLGEKERSARLSSEALDLFPAESHSFRSYARFNLAMLHQEGGDLVASGEAYADAVREAHHGGHFVLRVRASYGAGQLREAQGALREATRLYEEAREYARERHVLHTPAAGLLYAGLGRIRYQRNELDEAAVDLAEGLERVDLSVAETNPIYAVPCCFELLRLHTALGNTATADAMLERMEEIARAIEVPCLEPVLALMRVRQREAPAELVSAWLTAFEARTEGVELPSVPIPEVRVPEIRGLEIVTWARFRLAQGGTAERSKVVIAAVEARLERSMEAMVEQGRDGTALELRVLLATLHGQAGRRERAIGVLAPALELAEREGYLRVFVEAGTGLIPVLRQAAAQGIAPATVGTLLAALGKAERATGAPPDRGSPALIEPLSDRELEVLRLLAAGLSNNEIAAQLFLAVGTVKQHLHHIFGKLEVTSRTGAVARARALSLL
jgi:LuxR family transcriptional regulator, maltose regulon positive regulatory protein